MKKKLKFIKNNNILYGIYKYIFLRKYLKVEKRIFQELVKIEEFEVKDIYTLQEEILLNFLKYSYQNTKYYRRVFDENKIHINTIKSLEGIPLLTKDLIREYYDDLLSREYGKEVLCKRNTGGSTGEPLEFYSDRIAGYKDNAHHWYLYSLMGYKKGDIIIGSGGTVIPKELRDKNIFWIKEPRCSVWGQYDFSVLYITDKNVKYYINKLLEIKPAIMRGYPSFFAKMATYILENNIVLNFNIKGINLTAEMCSVSQRSDIEKAFSTMIYFEYGHTEICLYCYTKDRSYSYQSSPIYGYIEVLKEDGTEAKIGETGNIIVTGFNNHAMPFIRYDTGDRGEILNRNGGTVKFKKILGRNQDYIISKDKQQVFLTALIFGQHLKAFKNIIQWQLLQNEIGKVIVNIIKGKQYSIKDEKEIVYNFKNIVDIDLYFNYVDNIPLTKRGKHLFLIQNIEKSNSGKTEKV